MLKKDITFIYMDNVEKQIFSVIKEEAMRRGYKTKMTTNKFEKCEIGFYCQHVNFPEYSKFSLIMLHDLIQQYGNWPDIWIREPWNKYNVGFLPGKTWVENWNKCSQYFYARPKDGMYLVGWPKADVVGKYDKNEIRNEINKEYGLDPNKKTILYAPSWEYGGKQDEFVQAMMPLDVNILIKQYPYTKDNFTLEYKEVLKMNKLHENNPRVHIMNPTTNILYAIMACDVLVSDESSTMCEAIMMGKPAISVSNWLIPDTNPPRYPSVKYTFVTKTKKENLDKTVINVLNDYDKFHEEAVKYSTENFGEIGHTASKIMDIIDSYVEGIVPTDNLLHAKSNKSVPIRNTLFFVKEQLKRKILFKYCEINPFIKRLHKIYHLLKKH